MKKKFIILLIFSVWVILFLCVLLFCVKPIYIIPKVIWTYWDNDNIPLSVQTCITSWEIHNPDHTIVILNKKNLNSYIDEDVFNFKFATTPQRTSDFVRLCVLAKYGGTWADSTILMTKPLDNTPSVYEFIGYYLKGFTTKKQYPVIENWFFRCTPCSQFIVKWRDIFLSINNYETIEDYVEYMKKNIDVQNIQGLSYLTMHLAAQYVLQKDNIDRSKLGLSKAEDGPFEYLVKNNWNSQQAVEKIHQFKHQPIIKLRGPERTIVEKDKINLIIMNTY
jgi:hypothetical protein